MSRFSMSRRRAPLGFALLLLLGCGHTAATTTSPTTTATTAPPTVAAATPPATELPAIPPVVHPEGPPTVAAGNQFWSFLDQAVTSFGAATDGGYAYVVGGYHGTPHDYRPEGQSGAFRRMKLADGAWETLPSVTPLQGLALVAHAGKLCRVGGMRVFTEAPKLRSLDEVACYDAVSGVWRDLPQLPAARSSHDAIVVGHTLYVVGGWQLAGDASSGRFHDTIATLDLSRPDAQWGSLPAPFTRRGLALAATTSELLVAIGGMNSDEQLLRRVDVLDTRRGTWRAGPEFPGEAFGVAAVGIGDDVIAAGRDGGVYRLRPRATAWERIGELAFPRMFHRLVARSADELLAIGGIRGMTTAPRTRHIESIALRPTTDARFVALTFPYGGHAKNRQGVLVHDDEVFLFGGNVSLEQHDFEPQHFTREHEVLDLPSLSWRTAAPYPVSRQTMQTVVLGSDEAARGLSIGGFGHDGTVARTHPEAYVYAFGDDRWTQRAGALPSPRSQFALVDTDAKLYALGGLDYDPTREGRDQFRHVTSVLEGAVDDTSGAFAEMGIDIPEARRAFGAARLGNRVYLVGGMAGEFELVTTCRVFDLAARTFAPMTCPARTRLNPQLVALGDALYLVGGTSQQGTELAAERTIERYDPARDSWSVTLDTLPIEPRHARAFAYNGHLAVLSTHDAAAEAHLVLVTPPTATAPSGAVVSRGPRASARRAPRRP